MTVMAYIEFVLLPRLEVSCKKQPPLSLLYNTNNSLFLRGLLFSVCMLIY
jgi:hypothetical protein